MHNLFLVYFVNLYMFRAYLAHYQKVQPYVQSKQDNRQSSKKNNKYQFLYTYGCTSRW